MLINFTTLKAKEVKLMLNNTKYVYAFSTQREKRKLHDYGNYCSNIKAFPTPRISHKFSL